MEKLLKSSVLSYVFLAIFFVVWFAIFAFHINKKIRNTNIKRVVFIVLYSFSLSVWAYFLVYRNVFPIVQAFYEYKNSLTEESIGKIESIKFDGKDRIIINIDYVDYTMVYSSENPYKNITIDIIEGDMVWFQTGEHSKYIFDIKKIEDS